MAGPHPPRDQHGLPRHPDGRPPGVADAYEGAEFATDNMRRQAEIFREIHAEADRTVLGIWKNETSVCSVGDFARTTRRGNYYITENFYNVMKYLRTLRDNNYKIDKPLL